MPPAQSGPTSWRGSAATAVRVTMARDLVLRLGALLLVLLCAPCAVGFQTGPILRPSGRSVSPRGPHMMDPSTANFLLGGVAGTVSAVSVFPIDLVKTKMQGATTKEDVKKYASIPASVASIVHEDGVLGLWRGCGPVIFGSAPEAALQLAVHDYLIATLMVYFGAAAREAGLPIGWQCLAGALAGAGTLVATNPMEVLRLRAATHKDEGALEAMRKVGVLGLFKGFQATWLRDIPFGALYFPMYCRAKLLVAQAMAAQGDIATGAEEAILAGLMAGMVSSFLTVPFDTIKTRVQTTEEELFSPAKPRLVAAFTGQGSSLIRDTVLSMMAQGGVEAFTKGGAARVMRVAPTMAITLVIYEQLQNFFGVSVGPSVLGPFM